MEMEDKLDEAAATEKMKQPIIESDSIPEVDEKINRIKTEITGNLRKMLEFLEKEDVKKGAVVGFLEDFRNEYDSLYKQFYNLTTTQHLNQNENESSSDSSDDYSPKKKKEKIELSEVAESSSSKTELMVGTGDNEWKSKLELTLCQKILTEVSETNLHLQATNQEIEKALIEKEVEISNVISRAASRAGALYTWAASSEQKLHVLGMQKNAADATIVRLTEELGKRNEDNERIMMELENTRKDLQSLKDEMEVVQKSSEDEITRLNQRGEEKIVELEKLIAERDEKIRVMERKISEKESLISTLNETLESVITTATKKMSMA